MKKQYFVSFKNTNPRLSQTIRYLTTVQNGRPNKTEEINKATVFDTKAAARKAIASINKDDLYHVEVNIVDH